MRRLGGCAAAACLLLGCGVGKDTMLFTTNTTVGVDLDAKPPTASVAYSRQELVIAPQYQGGRPCAHPKPDPAAKPGGRGACCAAGEQIPSVLATIRNEMLGFTSRQSFLTGHAADLMAYGILKDADLERDAVCRAYLSSTGTAPADPDYKKPFFFGTNTVLGFDFRYNPTTGMPDAVALGFKRKELAYLPLMEIQSGADVVVEVPSVFAGAAVGVDLATGKKADAMQVFATGRAAEFLAASRSLRASLIAPALLGGELQKVRDVQEQEKAERAEQKRLGLQLWGRYTLLGDADKARMRKRAVELKVSEKDVEDAFKESLFLTKIQVDGPRRSELMKQLFSEFPLQ